MTSPSELKSADIRGLLVRVGRSVVRAQLLDTLAADVLWARLPLYGTAERGDGAVYVATGIRGAGEAGADCELGGDLIGFCSVDGRVVMAWEPASLPAPTAVWATALDSMAAFAREPAGARVAILQADN